MEKLKNLAAKVSQLNAAYILVLLLILKALVSDISYPTFLICIPVLGFEAYKLYLASKKPDPIKLSAEVQKNLDNMNSKISALTVERGLKAPAGNRW